MTPSATTAIVSFIAGILLLLGWAYATAGSPRSGAMFRRSLLLFVLPIFFAPWRLLDFPLAMWVWVACEEGLKAFASTQEHKNTDCFWQVSLFGIWELILDKPILLWAVVATSKGSWAQPQILGLVYAAALPVLMHGVTAAIYAFAFERRVWPAFAVSWLVHTSFNEAVDYFGLSVNAAFVETVVLLVILMAILKAPRRSVVAGRL